MTIPKDGSLVAWTIGLGKPGKKQTTFFNDKLGGEAQAQLTVLNPRSKLRSRAVGQGDPQKLTPFFGTTVQFPLAKSIPVKKGWVIALTVPTWAPALAVGLGADTSWRASRGKGTCEDTSTNTVQTQPNQLAQYYCLYKTARLAYSATLVTTPAPRRPRRPRRKTLGSEALDAPAVAGALVAQAIVQAPERPCHSSMRSGRTRNPPQCAGRGTSAPAKRCSTAATARSSSSREEMASLCGDAHALMRAARGRPAK